MSEDKKKKAADFELMPLEMYPHMRGARRPDRATMVAPAANHESSGIFEELVRRNIAQVVVLYLLCGWLALELITAMLRNTAAPAATIQILRTVVVLGLPVAAFAAWMNPPGSHRRSPDTGDSPHARARFARRGLHRAIAAVCGLVLVLSGVQSYRPQWFAPGVDEAREVAAREAAPAVAATSAPLAPPQIRLAVAPFSDASDAKDQGYLADGIAEQVRNILAEQAQLEVTGRDSSLRIRGTGAVQAGAALGVRFVVEGSVRRDEEQLHVTARLADASDGSLRWTESFVGPANAPFKLRAAIAGAIAQALGLNGAAAEVGSRGTTRSAEAGDLYLRARQETEADDRAGWERAIERYRQALDAEPQSAPVEAGLAEAYQAMTRDGYLAPQVGYEQARQAAQIAIMRDTNLADAHRVLSVVRSRYDWDWDGAARELRSAVSLQPHDPVSVAASGQLALSLGRLDEAVGQLLAARELDPLNPELVLALGWAELCADQAPKAEATLRQALRLRPALGSAHFLLGHALLAQGDANAALAEMKREVDRERRLAGQAVVLFAMGRKSESDTLLGQLRQLAATDWPSGIAGVHALRGEPELALTWLDRAVQGRDLTLDSLKASPFFRGVAHEARFAEILRKMRLSA